MRFPRQAQMDGEIKCTVGIPAARNFSSTPKLKSGASTPKKTLGRLAPNKSFSNAFLTRRMAGSCFKASTYPRTLKVSIGHTDLRPCACMRGPPIPYISKSAIAGICFNTCRLEAANKSPEGSPATHAKVGKVSLTNDAARRGGDKIMKFCQFADSGSI